LINIIVYGLIINITAGLIFIFCCSPVAVDLLLKFGLLRSSGWLIKLSGTLGREAALLFLTPSSF
jgi:hypothetical protein